MKLHCQEFGSGGPPLVLLHGFPLGSAMWVDVAQRLSSTAHVLVPDLRGHGRSPAPAGTYEMEQLADDVAELTHEHSLTTGFVLAGLSMGGYVAFAYVNKYASQLRGLILCDTRAGADTPDAAANRRAMADHTDASGSIDHVITVFLPKLLAEEVYEQNPPLVEQVRAMMADQPPAGVAACLRGMANRPDQSSLLPRIDMPTLVVVGNADRITPPAEAISLAAALPNARLHVIDRAGHLPPVENPQATADAIERFLRDL